MIFKILLLSLLTFLLLIIACYATKGQLIAVEDLHSDRSVSIDIAFTRDGRILNFEYGKVVKTEDLDPDELEMLPDSCGELVISGMLNTGDPICIPLWEIASVHAVKADFLPYGCATFYILPIGFTVYGIITMIEQN